VSPSGQAVTGAAASGSSSPSSGGRYSY